MENRYQRHIQLKEIGILGQEKIKNAKVLVVGAGGLGCPALQYLVGAGVGTVGVMDHDVVTPSNLQRQILFNEKDLGKNKALCAERHLKKCNTEVQIMSFPFPLTPENAAQHIIQFDLIIDCTDNFYTRYLINDYCVLLNKVMVYGALYKFEGQVSVFNYKNGPTYRCLFPTPPNAGEIPNCSEIGVLGVVPGVIGVYQASECIKIILELGSVLSGKVLCLNLLNHQNTILHFEKNKSEIEKILKLGKAIPIENHDCFIDFEVSLTQLTKKEKIRWIDVREPNELPQITHLNRIPKSISLKELVACKEKIIVFCQTGSRSKIFVQNLKNNGINNCFSLKEGAAELNRWALKQQ